ncbi:MAG: aminoglycoside phosphotransferase [Pseudonocardiaceae bacterium]
MDRDVDQANARFRGWMQDLLEKAAEYFSLTLQDGPTFGWRDRSIGSRAQDIEGDRWLRVVTSHSTWASGEFWTGNLDASAIDGVPKPRVLRVHEWAEEPRSIRAELMTLVPGQVCSDTQELRNELDLPDAWWTSLRQALGVLATHRTERVGATQEGISRRLLAFFGDTIDPTVTTWSTAHGDVQWANLTGPTPYLLDWEGWGVAPAGYDAATLYCYTLLVPDIARRVYETFADVLDTPDGTRAQLHVIGRLLLRVNGGDYPELANPLHQHAQHLLREQGIHR